MRLLPSRRASRSAEPLACEPEPTRRTSERIVTVAPDVSGFLTKQQIGTGAGSKIYEAIEEKTGRTVAIKHVVRNGPDDDRFLAQAETEYNISRSFDHPALRASYALIRVRKRLQVRELALVMEHVDGLNLEKARPNRLRTFLILFRKVAQGLGAMHEAGFVHTDIKPTNIMLARGGVVKIIDFGQSCPMHHRKDRIQGTPDYIAPEQVKRRALDRRTDVFNLGATMYWVLTSTKYPTAIQGLDDRGGIGLVKSEKPIAPVELNDKIPVSLSQLIMECCREDPAKRPADMKQVITRLAVVQKLWQKYRESVREKRIALPSESAEASTTMPWESEMFAAEEDA